MLKQIGKEILRVLEASFISKGEMLPITVNQ